MLTKNPGPQGSYVNPRGRFSASSSGAAAKRWRLIAGAMPPMLSRNSGIQNMRFSFSYSGWGILAMSCQLVWGLWLDNARCRT